MNVFEYIGKGTLHCLRALGSCVLFLFQTTMCGACPPYYWKQILKQQISIGFYSLPVIGLTAVFTGGVLALQSYTGFSRFSAQSALPTLVVLCITRELGPVIAGLMFAGRVGATIAAEIGTMKVTEQIDALATLATNAHKYLYWPRILAGMVTMPLLALIADIIGVFGGFIVAVTQLGFNAEKYINMTTQFLTAEDVISGLVKSVFFGMATTLIGCFQGAKSSGGAAGVGKATMNSVVMSSISILCLDYVLTLFLFHK
ncbi:MAG: ABC transporter permease [Holosporales bacterium]|jgi:phospholipid/cholesterol/gamma-HCH transport system permease protein|nr:ABC transporter permease [Holosporales bacterium]